MTTNILQQPPNSDNTQTYEFNHKHWSTSHEPGQPGEYRLVCIETGKALHFHSEAERAEFVAIWRAVEVPLADLEAIPSEMQARVRTVEAHFAKRDSEAARARALENMFANPNETINGKLEVR